MRCCPDFCWEWISIPVGTCAYGLRNWRYGDGSIIKLEVGIRTGALHRPYSSIRRIKGADCLRI